jgi:hypothetical protein
VQWVLDGHRGTVVDLGAGTGILTQHLVERGLDVIAVDPGGTAGLLWNPVDPAHPLPEFIVRTRRRLGLGDAEYDPSVELDRRWFGAAERAEFRFTRVISVEQFAAQLASRSYVAAAGETFRAEALEAARREAGALASEGMLPLPYRVTAIRARKPLAGSL